MAGIDLPTQKVIYTAGQPMNALHLIASGSVRVKYPGGEYVLGKGDVIGICEICADAHFLSYETLTETKLLSYPFTTMSALDDMLNKHIDSAKLFVVSAFRQINTLLNHCELAQHACNNLHESLLQHYSLYEDTCTKYRKDPLVFNNLEEVSAYISDEEADLWLSNYYLGLLHIFSDGSNDEFFEEQSLATGFLRKGSLDFRKTYLSLDEQLVYQERILRFYFDDAADDLFERYISLYRQIGEGSGGAEVLEIIDSIIDLAESTHGLENTNAAERISEFRAHLDTPAVEIVSKEIPQEDTAIWNSLKDSLDFILAYAELEDEDFTAWRKVLKEYKALKDKSSLDDGPHAIRREIISRFNPLYTQIAAKAVRGGDIPLPVLMFLYYGYMDEELAGIENCIYLAKLIPSLGKDTDVGVYPFFDWLRAIYEGKKEPSRNEFEEDYSDYLHKQKAAGTITDAEMQAFMRNNGSKVSYELRNMFQNCNKITFGRISTFCPVFTSDNVLKKLPSSHVTAATVGRAIEQIRSIDYSVFYRETLTTSLDPTSSLKENVHVEYLPDIILLPNVGTRGVMWQEIEGKKRNSPARMMFSIFHMEDINTSLIRLAGEFRWEMCKRIQGYRWNDVADRSLTSEYFDYIQFYRKNNELTTEMKERVKQSLQRAKNSFKEMFIRDYILWILFEGTGSPRLNKVARRILFTYCPFSRDIRSKLSGNPQYGDIIQRYELHTSQKVHRFEQISQKLKNAGTQVPTYISDELLFFNK